MKIANYITSLTDYPGKTCTTLFTIDCNFRCGFCHNWKLFAESCPEEMPNSMLFDVLTTRLQLTPYITVTGGEPCLYIDLPDFLFALKRKGFKVKLDTNGSYPTTLKNSLPYADYVAMDIKTSPSKYPKLYNFFNVSHLKHSIFAIKKSGLEYEFRTTMVPSLVNEDTFEDMIQLIDGAKRYRLLQYNNKAAFTRTYKRVKPYTDEDLLEFAKVAASSNIEEVYLNNNLVSE